MKIRVSDIDEIQDKLTSLMVYSDHPEDNAYNSGLGDAILVISGGSVESIKKSRDAYRRQALSNDMQ